MVAQALIFRFNQILSRINKGRIKNALTKLRRNHTWLNNAKKGEYTIRKLFINRKKDVFYSILFP